MKIKYKKIEKVKAAEIALKHRLFIPGWQLRDELISIISFNNIYEYEIELAFDGTIPIGICLKKYYNEDRNQLMVFVRKAYRNKNIGRKLVSLLKDSNSYGEVGIHKSDGKIWKLNNIECI